MDSTDRLDRWADSMNGRLDEPPAGPDSDRLSLGALTLVMLACLTGCGDDEGNARCQRAVDHVIMPLPTETGTPSPEEMQIIRTVRAMALATCQREGLSEAQEACILAARTMDERLRLGRCPAIRERKPSWLQLPPPELVDDMDDPD